MNLNAEKLKSQCIDDDLYINCRIDTKTGESLIYVNGNTSFKDLIKSLTKFALKREEMVLPTAPAAPIEPPVRNVRG